MSAEWYCQIKGTAVGPFASKELRDKAQSGEVTGSTLVRKGTSGEWVQAFHINGLFAGAELPPTPEPGIPEPPAAQRFSNAEGPVPIQWYVTVDGEQKGPLSDDAICRWAADGRMQKDSFVRKGVDGEWNLVESFDELSELDVRSHSNATKDSRKLHLLPDTNSIAEHAGWRLVLLAILSILGAFLMVGVILSSGSERHVLLLVAAIMSACMCGVLGAIAGSFRNADGIGAVLGFLCGPLGVFVSLVIDGRPECPECGSRLNGSPKTCPYCHARVRKAA